MIVRKQRADHNWIRPTAAQIDKNIVGIPRPYIEETRNLIRWSSGFDVIVKGKRVANRHLDRENRVGGLPLRGHVRTGELLRLSIESGVLVLTAEGDHPSEVKPPTTGAHLK